MLHLPKALIVALALTVATAAHAQSLTKSQIQEFMVTAEIVASEPIGKGVTKPWRLTLSDGMVTHDVGFQSVDQKRDRQRLGGGATELKFVDAYRYNLAAYRVAELLGLDDMMPVTVERVWDGQRGALTWWIDDVMMDEETMLADGRRPDDVVWHSQQVFRMLVFAELVYDTDWNHGNILYGSDWKLWMIDFTRAFRLWDDLQAPQSITQCDRALLERMRDLTRARLEEHTKPYLTPGELDAVMNRRDKLVAHFGALIAQRGEQIVLY